MGWNENLGMERIFFVLFFQGTNALYIVAGLLKYEHTGIHSTIINSLIFLQLKAS